MVATILVLAAVVLIVLAVFAAIALLVQSVKGSFATDEDRRTLWVLFMAGLVAGGSFLVVASLFAGH